MDDVLIVGAGPTGLALAIWLRLQGVGVRIVDRSEGPGRFSRAMVVQARTLELYRQAGLAEAVVAAGNPNPGVNLWARGRRRARIAFGDAGAKLTPYPFVLVYPQDRHERLLVERLAALGVEVERETELVSFEERGDHVVARVSAAGGGEREVAARYLAGCDGARSATRRLLGSGFEGGTYRQLFYVADVALAGLEPEGEIHVALDTSDFLAVLAYGGGRSRLIGTVRDERADRADELVFADVDQEAIRGLGLDVRSVSWFSTYHVHHRIADGFRRGRALVAGDAAHVHSPAGGQGMNTGLLDAINLAWKLAAVVQGRAPDGLLDSYDAERRAFARRLVATTDRVFTFATAEGSLADFVRTRVAPAAAGAAWRFGGVRQFLFRTLSQTQVGYEESPLSAGAAGSVRGGDRLPWAAGAAEDNYAPLAAIGWQAHVYGVARPELRDWCAAHGLPLHVFGWEPAHEAAGLARDGVYLLRPDTWVGLADPEQSVAALEGYLAARGLVPVAAA